MQIPENLKAEIGSLLLESDMLFCLWSEGDHTGSREIDYLIGDIEDITLSYGLLIDNDKLERRLESIVEASSSTSLEDAIIYSVEDSIIQQEEVAQ